MFRGCTHKICIFIFFCKNLVLVSWQASFHYLLVMKLDFISQLSSKSTLPFAGLQHMQQCQVNFYSILAPGFWSKWMMPEKWSAQKGFELRMRELYKRFVKTWIRFANPWIHFVLWSLILTPKRFVSFCDHESWIRIISWITNPDFKRFVSNH